MLFTYYFGYGAAGRPLKISILIGRLKKHATLFEGPDQDIIVPLLRRPSPKWTGGRL